MPRTSARALILNVDDSSTSRYWRTLVLRRAGYDVVEAAAGEDAVRLVGEHRPPLVVLDVTLPDVNGLEVCRRIKAAHGSATLVLLVSALSVDATARVAGLDAGADGYLVMPADPEELLAQVRALLRLQAAEQAARESEARFRTMADELPVMIWVTDANGAVQFVNETYRQFFGASEEQIRQSGWQPLLHPDDVERYAAEYAACSRERRPFHCEARVRRADGEWRWVESFGSPRRSPGGDFRGFVGTSPDVTERKRAEIEREEVVAENARLFARAQEANRLKDEFLAMLSHELRTPLNVILGWNSLLKTSTLDARQERAVRMIETNARAQAQLVSDILDVSRIESGKLSLERKHVPVGAEIHAVVDGLRPAAVEKGVAVQVDVPAADAAVTGDPARLQQVLWNLLSNAIKFTPPGGHIAVNASATADEIVIEVRDDGVGIAREFLPFVFERFRQADASTTRAHSGIGLGLAIAKDLVGLHGGTIAVESDGPHHGATFTVRLPRAAAACASQPPVASLRHVPLSVLVVDDHQDTREMMNLLLAAHGAHVTTAASCGDAVAAYRDAPVEIALIDIAMPDQDGYDCLRQLRQQAEDLRRPLAAIAVTAHAGERDRRDALSAGFVAHVAKPVDLANLLEAVAAAQSAIDRRRA